MSKPTNFIKITEQASKYNHLEEMSVHELLTNINKEDQTVPLAVAKELEAIERVIEVVVQQLKDGGRLFYIGAGTSGRLGVVDASECPPTFGVPDDLVIGLIAGGDTAIRKAVENAEDSPERAVDDLQAHKISKNDVIIGIAASGTTPYVLGAIDYGNANGIPTACITCNPNSPLALMAQYPIVVVVGPEFVTGSSRMKAGTAQKLVLNMISTATMIQLGHVKGNKMVDMKLSNQKLNNRAVAMVVDALGISEEEAKQLVHQHQSVRKAIESYEKSRTNGCKQK